MKHNYMRAVSALALTVMLLTACGTKNEFVSESTKPTPAVSSENEAPESVTTHPGKEDASVGTDTRPDEDASGAAAPELTKVEVDEPNNINYNGYKERVNTAGQRIYETYKNNLKNYNLVPLTDADGNTMKLDTGHTIYVKAQVGEEAQMGDTVRVEETEGDEEAETEIEGNGEEDVGADTQLPSQFDRADMFIISGYEPVPCDGVSVKPDYDMQLREEETCERIKVFSSEAAYQQAKENYQDGQAILSGQRAAPKNSIIIDGALIPNAKFSVGEDGVIRIPLRTVSEYWDEHTMYNDVDSLLYVPSCSYDWTCIPSTNALPNARQYFEVGSGEWTYQYAGAPEPWSGRFEVAKDDEFTLPVTEVSRILGWEIWYNDDLVNIITDDLNNNDNYVLHKSNQTVEYEDVPTDVEEDAD